MLTTAQMHALFEDVLTRMLKAGWLRDFSFTDGKGWHLGWTLRGAAAAQQLARWDRLLGITHKNFDSRAAVLSELAHGLAPPTRGAVPGFEDNVRPLFEQGWAVDAPEGIDYAPEGVAFLREYRMLVDDLQLRGDADRLLVMFHIAKGWEPGPDTPVKVHVA